jgi:hypothetical protein
MQMPFSVCHPTHPTSLTAHLQCGTSAKLENKFEKCKYFQGKMMQR